MSPASGSNPSRFRIPRWLRLTVGTLVVAAALCFLVSRLIRDWSRIPFDDLEFNALCLAGSFLLLLVLHFPLYGHAWRLVLGTLGERIPLPSAVAVFASAQLGKYIPGKVWFTLGRMSLAKREGVPEDRTLVSIFVETVFALLSATVLFGISILLVPRGAVPGPVYFVFAAVPLCLLLLYPPLLNRILGAVLRRLKRPVFRLEASYGRLLYILLVYTLDWLVQGISCWLLISSFYRLPFAHLPVLLGGYAISWMLGFLTLIAPAGLGIREGIFTFVLRLIVTEPIAIISALVTRVWITLAEALMALVSVLYLGVRRKNAQEAKNPQA